MKTVANPVKHVWDPVRQCKTFFLKKKLNIIRWTGHQKKTSRTRLVNAELIKKQRNKTIESAPLENKRRTVAEWLRFIIRFFFPVNALMACWRKRFACHADGWHSADWRAPCFFCFCFFLFCFDTFFFCFGRRRTQRPGRVTRAVKKKLVCRLLQRRFNSVQPITTRCYQVWLSKTQ